MTPNDPAAPTARRVRTVLRRRAPMLLLAFGLAACASRAGGGTVPAAEGPTSAAAVSSSGSPAPAQLVGEWQRLQRCSELARVMSDAGLRRALLESIAGDGWIPGVTAVSQIKDRAHPCRGSVARTHSHFFTSDGLFGSRDADGRQVDDGSYQLVGEDTVVIGGVAFHYTIDGGETLHLTPEIPDCAPTCFEAGWSLAVAYPGFAWHRVP